MMQPGHQATHHTGGIIMAIDLQQPDMREPSDERKAELESAYQANIVAGKAPYEAVTIHTGGELQWIMAQRKWSGALSLPEGMQRANLSKVNLIGVILSGVRLDEANLSNATLRGAILNNTYLSLANLSNVDLSLASLENAYLPVANLRDAYLTLANLRGASLTGAYLSNARLGEAILSNADLSIANLSEAYLGGAILSGTVLRRANLSGTDLARALMTAETVLDDIALDTHTKFFGTRWNGVPLDGVDWAKAPRLGDEPTSENLAGKKASEKALLCRNAVRAYHGLSIVLRDQGLADTASKYRLRELAMERKAMRYERNFGGWLLNVLLGAVAGHGEKPGRAFAAYLSIITTFALIFWGVTNFLHTGSSPLQWYEAAVLSVSSFHGRGFFTSTIQLGDPLAIVAAFEAVFGLFIELVFIATFSRRFLGD
jgi:uncharacterized protein YjbI with pentapeptide repeats